MKFVRHAAEIKDTAPVLSNQWVILEKYCSSLPKLCTFTTKAVNQVLVIHCFKKYLNQKLERFDDLPQ